jgi:MoxR-like ATPase
MKYQKYFTVKEGEEPEKQVRWPKPAAPADGKDGDKPGAFDGEDIAVRAGDRRDGLVYVYNDKIELAVNVALATGRPMLVRGPSGCGKSSLARNVALRMGWRYYEQVVTSRTQARDLLWTFDSVRRLSDATTPELKVGKPADYVEPSALWWAFDPASAKRRGLPEGESPREVAKDPGVGPEGSGAVVLLDEIDKADPDVPNNLLVPLGSFQFDMKETNATPVVLARPLLLFITTNDERVLPTAFMRRCVVLELDPPKETLLVSIAEEHYGEDKRGIYLPIAEKVVKTASEGKSASGKTASGQPAPSTAEYLDTVRAFLDLNLNPSLEEAWKLVSEATLLKRQTPA